MSQPEEIAAILRRQHGVIGYAQARAAGMTKEAIRWQVADGRWVRVRRGVYRLASATLTWHVRAHTLVQLLGDTGALTLHAAAHLHGVETRQPPIITGAVTGRTVKRVTGTRVATRKKLEVVTRDNLPVTTAASTVLDLTDIPGTTWREGVHTVARWIHRTPSPLRSCPQHSRHAPATSTVPSSAPPCPRSSREQRASSRCRPSTA